MLSPNTIGLRIRLQEESGPIDGTDTIRNKLAFYRKALPLHEAGHAVVAKCLGMTPELIYLSLTRNETSDPDEAAIHVSGHTKIPGMEVPDSGGPWSRDHCIDRIRVALAGNAAVSSLTRESELSIESLSEGPDGKADLNVINAWLDELPTSPSIKERGLIMRREWKRARQLLHEQDFLLQTVTHAAAIKLEAAGGLGSITLEGEELAALLRK